MASDQPTPPLPAQQRAVAEQVLETMANIRILPGEFQHTSLASAEPMLRSSLEYTAPANQLLLLECAPELALQLSAQLFDRPRPNSTGDADTLDTMAELVNMIGGNLKALMPPGTSIGLPFAGDPQEMRAQGARELSRLTMGTAFGPLYLTFFEWFGAQDGVPLTLSAEALFQPQHHVGPVPIKEV